MPVLPELTKQLQELVDAIIRFIKARRREEATIGFAAVLFWIAYSFSGWLTPEVIEFLKPWRVVLILQVVCYVAGFGFLIYGGYRVWKLVHVPEPPPIGDRPAAIKGPQAFTPEDGELFRKLGRENELQKLLGYIQDDQVRVVVLMGASGAGKTSLLRAGLTHLLADKNIGYHYWEAVPTDPGAGLLRAIQESWNDTNINAIAGSPLPSSARPESLLQLVNPSSELCSRKHVIVLDQFEQLRERDLSNNPVFILLRKIARLAKPPHRITWIVAFRREFRADWSDLMLPEHERGFFPPELSLRLFSTSQAREVIGRLIDEAKLAVEQSVVNNLLEAASVDGEVLPVDIGIGLLVLAELHDQQGGRTVTSEAYQFAGGAEGLLTQYISRCLESFLEGDRDTILKAMLALRDPETNQRIAEGRTGADLAQEAGADARRIKLYLDRLAQRDIRLLETVSTSDETAPRYRLPHERLIPALHRLTGRLLAEVDQAKLKFENAFAVWKRNNETSQYLLTPKDLRLIEPYQNQIPWGNDELAKRKFLNKSRSRRSLRRLGMVAAILGLCVATWWGNLLYQRFDDRRFLQDNNYPAQLYDWQQQLKVLKLREDFNLQRFSWLHSNTLEELEIKAESSSNSLAGLTALTRCNALKKLTLDLSESQVSNLTPLEKLSGLTQLTLDLSESQVSDLTPLEKLSRLTQLTLDLSECQVSNLTPLEKLSSLSHLTLDLSKSMVSNLAPLAKLPGFTQLTLNLSAHSFSDLTVLERFFGLSQLTLDLTSWFGDLPPLEKLSGLTQLTLNLGYSKVGELTLLKELSSLTYLKLDLTHSQVTNLSPLEKLTNLTNLTLDLSESQVSNLTPLEKLINLTQLTLRLEGSRVRDLSPLEKLTSLSQLTLDLNNSVVRNLPQLEKLIGLSQLTLDLYNNYQVRDLPPLEKLAGLSQLTLRLASSKVRDLPPLEKLTGLSQLTLGLGRGEVWDLPPLENLTGLSQLTLILYLYNDYIREVRRLPLREKLTGLSQLTLDLSNNDVKDLPPLEELHCLSQLTLILKDMSYFESDRYVKLTGLAKLWRYLNASQVRDLTSLAKLDSLETLVLEVNSAQRMSLRALPPRLTHLEF